MAADRLLIARARGLARLLLAASVEAEKTTRLVANTSQANATSRADSTLTVGPKRGKYNLQ